MSRVAFSQNRTAGAEPPAEGFRQYPLWLLAAVGVVVAQAGLALSLFSSPRTWQALTDDRPILSGWHPLHLYHGTLGAAAFRERQTTTCYDPAFQAGYPKTPVFDSGCRPAEIFALLGGPGYNPAAYKIGLFAFMLLIPGALIAAARGAGVPAGAAVWAGLAGVLLSWSPAVRQMLEEGQLDLLAAGLAAAVFVPWLGRYARQPGIESWIVLALLAAAGWYAHPLVWIGLGPVLLIFYLVFAPRHGPGWHLGLAGITSFGVVPNAWWLVDWAKYWWLRQPSAHDDIPLPSWATVLGQWDDYWTLWNGLPGGLLLPMFGVVGLIALWLTHHRAAAGLALVAVVVSVAAARFAAAWPRMPAAVPAQVAPLAVTFLVPAASFAVWQILHRFWLAKIGTIMASAGLLLVAWADGPQQPLARGLGLHTEPLIVGFTPEQHHLLQVLRDYTTPEARILWEAEPQRQSHWSALLPLYTHRAYIGGLDIDAEIDHGYCALCNHFLNGRPLTEWSDEQLTAYCRWYNIGWVVCRGGRAAERWSRYPHAQPLVRLVEGGQPVVLFTIDRPRSFILSGQAHWQSADSRRIVLTDVRPDAEGYVVLSLHAFEGLRVYPSYVQLQSQSEPTIQPAIDHIRLKTHGPVPRITLRWEQP
ncbi:MAG: hypothetical protein RMJ56_14955 [Gemmataceae bacterium]|nr:hypothetical protein [Gemmata sp.]MDW8198895.1 hypothetical protein [Gemmataceae bacterium]